MTIQANIPDGYRQDVKGSLVPVERIKPIDLLRDELVMALVDRGRELNKQLANFKAGAFSEIDTFVEQSAAEYGTKFGGKKGNISLLSFDGKYKVQIAIQDSITFDERLMAAKALIDECLKDWTADARSEVATIVQDVFRVDKAGNIRPAQVLSLRRLDITDKRWLRAMDAISDAVQVTGSKSYIRLYERVGQTDQYKPISLDIAGV